jgi:hypothetical protein
MTSSTITWWTLLCSVSAINLLAWLVSAVLLHRRSETFPEQTWTLIRWQMVLSAGYVLGCGYRSVFPVFDVQRQVIVDSFFSSVIVGRSVATVAELCFAAQWALLLRGIAHANHSWHGITVSRLVVPMIVVAEVCSWYAVLSTSNMGHVLEESLWGLCALLLVASLVLIWPRCDRDMRSLLAATCVAGTGYVLYMFLVDVPMYWTRWVQDNEAGRVYLGIYQGLVDTSSRWTVTHQWNDWKGEVVWMSLYFSVAVWLSIGLMHMPVRYSLRYATVTSKPPWPTLWRPLPIKI